LEAHLRCRAIAADGDVHVESDAGAPQIANLSEIPAEGWLSLSTGARLVAKDPRTTRETTFLGPGRVRVCIDRHEESWIASGSFESVVGAGETPGAEEWVVTAQAVVRYAAARLRIDTAPNGTHLRVANGVAFLWPPQGEATSEGWQRVTAPEMALDGPPRADPAAAGAAVDRCVSLSERSHALARVLLFPEDGEPAGGNVAAEQVTARRLARAGCALAALRVDALPPGDGGLKQALSVKVLEAETAWRSLPLAGSSP
jgi:hypothetical protein